MQDSEYAVEMLGITKAFSGIKANDDITLRLKKGEIHALLGENGAGKSTLMSILFGMYEKDSGKILVDGKEVNIKDPNDANRYGIGMVHQHFKLVEVFTVLENIVLGCESVKNGVLDMKTAKSKFDELIKKYDLELDANALIEDLTVGQQQKCEILKMLYRDNNVLIFDEPTAVLTPQQIEVLMQTMKNLAKEGKSILFITHKLNEIMEVADRCSVLRRGKYIGTVNVKDTNEQELSEMMVGRPVSLKIDKKGNTPTRSILKVENLTVIDKIKNKKLVNNVSLDVKDGEIICIAGIDGNGQQELVNSITGLESIDEGKIFICDENMTNKNIRYKNTHGLSHIPADRHKHGLVLDYTMEQNMVLQRYFEPEFSNNGFIKFKEIRKYSDMLINKYSISSGLGSINKARLMSGGNQQKIILAREIDRPHKLLIAVQPTRGLDVGAVEFIHKQIIAARDAGAAVLLVSYELEEVMSLSDKIYVMFEGEITGRFKQGSITANELGLYMSGAKKDTMEVA